MQYKQGCAVGIRYILSTNEHVLCEQGASSAQMSMSNTSEAHLLCECGCTVRVMYVFTANDEMKYNQDISSI